MNLNRLGVLFIFTAFLSALLSGCMGASDPIGTVKAFDRATAKGDFDKAAKFVVEEKRKDVKQLNFIRDMIKDLPRETKKTIDTILNDINYELVSQEGNKATVRATIDFTTMMKEFTGTTGSPLMGITKMSVNYLLEQRDMKWQIVDARPAMGM